MAKAKSLQQSRPAASQVSARNWVFRLLAIAQLLLGVMYLYWRCTAGFNYEAFGPSLLLLIAEFLMLMGTFGFVLSQIKTFVPPYDAFGDMRASVQEMPYVDVFILRESSHSIAATCQTAKDLTQLNYPWHRLYVHIVDTGTDPDLEKAATTVPCDYIACLAAPGQSLQYLLREISTFGEFILLVVPGQTVASNILEQTIPYFFDTPTRAPIANNVGFVQTMVRTLSKPKPDHPLQQPIPIGEFGGEAAPLLGNGTVLRRTALEMIPDIDLSQPLMLGGLLHQRGWKSYLCRTVEVQGALLPLRDRLMSLLALLQTLRLNLWWERQTSQAQKFQYLWYGLWSMSGVASVMLFVIPIWFLFTGVTPVPEFNREFLTWFLPYAIVGRLAWLTAFPRHLWRAAWVSECQTHAQFYQSIQSILLSLRGVKPWLQRSSVFSFGPQTLLLLLMLAAIIVGTVRFFTGWQVTPLAFSFGIAWAVYNLLQLSVRPPGLEEALERAPVAE
ncbi:MAG: cellulose synthase [Cyanobacteria bacterium P01_D01_bin.123]